MRYETKIDLWIGASMLAGLVLPILVAISESSLWPGLFSVAAAILIFGCCYPQWYETTPDVLVVRAGLTIRRIPYAQITAVRPTSEARSSNVMSLDRVRLEYAGGEQLIAPKDQQAFFADLQARAPQLSMRGQELVISIA